MLSEQSKYSATSMQYCGLQEETLAKNKLKIIPTSVNYPFCKFLAKEKTLY